MLIMSEKVMLAKQVLKSTSSGMWNIPGNFPSEIQRHVVV